MSGLFGFLVVNPYDIFKTSCGKVATIVSIIQGENLIIWLNTMPELFSGFGEELEQMPISVGSQHHSTH